MHLTDGRFFCTYCRFRKPLKGSVVVRDRRGLQRNKRCGDCQALRVKPAKARDAHAAKRTADKKAAEQRRMEDIAKKRNTIVYKDSQ